MTVTIGKPVDDFTAKATSGISVSLKDLKGKTNFVLYFYPKDNTPGCTSEGQAFAENLDAFKEADTIIFGVSKDTMKAHENFKAKYEFPFELISDSNEELCKLFDVIRLKKMYGKEFMGIERSTFLIDKEGTLQHEWRKVRIKNHVEDVLQAAQALEGMVEPITSTLDKSSDN
ncbi:peroxiredoxin [Sansalvadorimonas sp. 2012CJ34-2]|uniref:thioredoxin-dependent peroxiredoxin n=1 Tax=Parendozoicomonas callyspongiae TaxID=2942213 RepID=A0ABT0PGW2_9GAMM|nr:peroxiredoxin [Sansalvadorimonas sp. 2012CJ34-2]MCL6270251.1 peroxiredoxin [Sansalvadorimonas sp. 2012CJ34-2]